MRDVGEGHDAGCECAVGICVDTIIYNYLEILVDDSSRS